MRAAFGLLLVVAALEAATRPSLLVLIVAEQFRADYLDRYRSGFGPGGFQRLLKGGAVYRNCRYEYLATFPASGAAVLATGAYPDRNGIVAESWYDRAARRIVRAVEDPEHSLVGSAAQPTRPGASPRHLVGATLADQLRLATGGRSRAISISLRDQTAVLLGGLGAEGCYWLDAAGQYITSSYYTDTLPAWAAAFNRSHPVSRFRGRPWRALEAKDTAPPLRLIDGKGPAAQEDFLATWLASPFAMEEQFDFARQALDGEQLGLGGSSDVLVLSLSSLYWLGLETGADSPLMRDMILRLDRKLEEFFSRLDARYGADNVAIVFTATQGLIETPEALQMEGIRAGRVSGEQIGNTVNARLSAAFGRERYVEKYVFPSLYLRRQAVEHLAGAEVLRLAGEAALAVWGVAGYLAPDRSTSVLAPETAPLFARSIFPGRSGDLLLAYLPYYCELYGDGRGVSTGSFYSYDTRVPLLLYGTPFRAATFDQPVSPTDLAPTLAAAFEIPPPASATGRVLLEALQPASPF